MGYARTAAVLAQVRSVVEDQEMSVSDLCALLQLDVHAILDAFEDNAYQYADQFGVNVDLIGDLVEEPTDDDEMTEYEDLLKEHNL